ncbi:hypothetical protein L7F22_033593 [Adiantum nelumboides]|nr:hypothetical protein [Adiantum nelumboides]
MTSAALAHIFGAVAGELLRNKLEEHSDLKLSSGFETVQIFGLWLGSVQISSSGSVSSLWLIRSLVSSGLLVQDWLLVRNSCNWLVSTRSGFLVSFWFWSETAVTETAVTG